MIEHSYSWLCPCRRKSTLHWQRLKQLLQNPLQLLEKVSNAQIEGPRPVFEFLLLLAAPWSTCRRKGVLPEHLHAYIMQLGSPAEMDAEKAKEHCILHGLAHFLA